MQSSKTFLGNCTPTAALSNGEQSRGLQLDGRTTEYWTRNSWTLVSKVAVLPLDHRASPHLAESRYIHSTGYSSEPYSDMFRVWAIGYDLIHIISVMIISLWLKTMASTDWARYWSFVEVKITNFIILPFFLSTSVIFWQHLGGSASKA